MPLGIMGASAEAGGVIGPLWGGLISRFLDWEWVFWINLPLGFAVIVWLLLVLPAGSRRAARIDWLGGALLAVGLSALTLALSMIDALGVSFALWLALAAAAFGLFVLRSLRVDDPLLPLSMFRSAPVAAANLTHLLIGAALIIGMVTVPLMANTALGLTALDGGLMLMRMTAALPFGAVLGGYAAQRFGCRAPVRRRSAADSRRIPADERLGRRHIRPAP